MTPVKVVDASAIAAILFKEPELADVQARLGDGPLYAPSMFVYEVGNICRTKCLRHPEERDDLLAGFAQLPSFGIEEVEISPHHVMSLALATGLTFYDASYLWLARELSAELVTLDQALARAASG